jgi:SNF2 family DNA or RNA helicase
MDQSMARAHRIGSEAHESILRVDYVAPGTIEEAVIARLEGKSAGLEAVVKDKELLAKALRGIT